MCQKLYNCLPFTVHGSEMSVLKLPIIYSEVKVKHPFVDMAGLGCNTLIVPFKLIIIVKNVLLHLCSRCNLSIY